MPPKRGTKAANEREESLRRRYPPLNGVRALIPCVIVDVQGIIVTWYLPGILSNTRQVGLLVCPIAAENLTPLRSQCWQREKNYAHC
jgi:hypothetical protein